MSGFKYYSSVEGSLFIRPPSIHANQLIYIGAKREGKKIEWNEEISKIPNAEYLAFRKEYKRAVRVGTIKERTETEYNNSLIKERSEVE